MIENILTKTNGGYRKSHDFRDKSVHTTGAISEESYTKTGSLCFKEFLFIGSINFQVANPLGSNIVNVSIV